MRADPRVTVGSRVRKHDSVCGRLLVCSVVFSGWVGPLFPLLALDFLFRVFWFLSQWLLTASWMFLSSHFDIVSRKCPPSFCRLPQVWLSREEHVGSTLETASEPQWLSWCLSPPPLTGLSGHSTSAHSGGHGETLFHSWLLMKFVVSISRSLECFCFLYSNMKNNLVIWKGGIVSKLPCWWDPLSWEADFLFSACWLTLLVFPPCLLIW